MTHVRLFTLFLCLVAVTTGAAEAQIPDTVPVAWAKVGSTPADYIVTIDRATYRSGGASAQLRSRVPTATGFGTLTQRVRADSLKNVRIRVSAWLRTREAQGALLFVRVDGAVAGLDFANTADDPVSGTSEWTRRELVVDVPDDALGVTFGLMLGGTGTVWIDDVVLDVVSPATPRSGQAPPRPQPSADTERMLRERYAAEPTRPRNLGFEEVVTSRGEGEKLHNLTLLLTARGGMRAARAISLRRCSRA